jgi:hypothetical protein
MILKLNDIELELPDGSKVEISNDGKTAKVIVPEAEVVERIRIVEVEGPETIRYIPTQIQPYIPPSPQPYQPWSPWVPQPHYPWGTTSGGTVTLDGTGGGRSR